MWEEAGEWNKAIEVYEKGFDEVLALGEKRSNEATLRGVAIALKIGDLLSDHEQYDKAEGRYVWGLEELMRMNMTEEQMETVKREMNKVEGGEKETIMTGDSKKEDALPDWTRKVELVGALERLGGLYATTGKIEYAQPLLQQAIASLLPPPSKDPKAPKTASPSVSNRCHAATLVSNVSLSPTE